MSRSVSAGVLGAGLFLVCMMAAIGSTVVPFPQPAWQIPLYGALVYAAVHLLCVTWYRFGPSTALPGVSLAFVILSTLLIMLFFQSPRGDYEARSQPFFLAQVFMAIESLSMLMACRRIRRQNRPIRENQDDLG